MIFFCSLSLPHLILLWHSIQLVTSVCKEINNCNAAEEMAAFILLSVADSDLLNILIISSPPSPTLFTWPGQGPPTHTPSTTTIGHTGSKQLNHVLMFQQYSSFDGALRLTAAAATTKDIAVPMATIGCTLPSLKHVKGMA